MTSNFELEGVHVHVRVLKINLEQSMYKNLINMVGFFYYLVLNITRKIVAKVAKNGEKNRLLVTM